MDSHAFGTATWALQLVGATTAGKNLSRVCTRLMLVPLGSCGNMPKN